MKIKIFGNEIEVPSNMKYLAFDYLVPKSIDGALFEDEPNKYKEDKGGFHWEPSYSPKLIYLSETENGEKINKAIQKLKKADVENIIYLEVASNVPSYLKKYPFLEIIEK